jgi:hypothetical protein
MQLLQYFGAMTDYRQTLRDIFTVSAAKPVGFVQLGTVKVNGRPVDEIVRELEAMDLRAMVFSERECQFYTGALYAFHETALQGVLDRHATTLAAAGWPVTAGDFIRHLASHWAPEKTPLYDAVADAFGDKTNPCRTDVEIPADTDDPFLQQLRAGNNPFQPK